VAGSVIQPCFASTLLHSGGEGSPPADGACAYSFAMLELQKPRAPRRSLGRREGAWTVQGGLRGQRRRS
jgi:hypothetical protein